MTRLMLIALISLLNAAQFHAQQPPAAPAPTQANADPSVLPQAELLRRIDLYETALHKPGIDRIDDASVARVYASLGNCYLDLAMYLKAEDAMHHAIALMRSGPQATLADEIGQLAGLHFVMGDPKLAEKAEMEALQIRQQIGDPVGIALAWNDLANLYIGQRQFSKALDYAQRAMPALASNPSVQASDRIAIRQTLASALCGMHQCDRGIPLLQQALSLARDNFGADSLAAGVSSYMLGYGYWQNGQMDAAADYMQRGTERMKQDWDWGYTLYVKAVEQYAKFLHQRGQTESATLEERELRHMTETVDARSFVGR
jgi:tetratricopeptide (TPR) repeat protein